MSATYLMLMAAVCVALVAAQATPAISAPPVCPPCEPPGSQVTLPIEQVCAVSVKETWVSAWGQHRALMSDLSDKNNVAVAKCHADNAAVLAKCHAARDDLVTGLMTNMGANMSSILGFLKGLADNTAVVAELNANHTAATATLNSIHAGALATVNSDHAKALVNATARMFAVINYLKVHSLDIYEVGPRVLVALAVLMGFASWVMLSHPGKRSYWHAFQWSVVQFLIINKILLEENALSGEVAEKTHTRFAHTWYFPGAVSNEWCMDCWLTGLGCFVIFLARGVSIAHRGTKALEFIAQQPTMEQLKAEIIRLSGVIDELQGEVNSVREQFNAFVEETSSAIDEDTSSDSKDGPAPNPDLKKPKKQKRVTLISSKLSPALH